MINRISQISGIKKGVLAAMMLAGTAMYAANPIKNSSNDIKQNQTEVVSKEAAEALKSNMVQQTTTPTVHNAKLDNTLRKFIESEEDKEYIENIIKTAYENCGTFMGSAIIQHEIDIQMLYALMTGNTNLLIKNNINPNLAKEIQSYGQEFFKSIKPNEPKVTDWMMNKYKPNMIKALATFNARDGKAFVEDMDDLTKYGNLSKDEIVDYLVHYDTFDYKDLKRKRDTQSLADLAAYKMFIIDKIIIQRHLHRFKVLGEDAYYKGKKPMFKYTEDWMNSVEPKFVENK